MYTIINVVDNAILLSEDIAFKDRMRYKVFIELGEKFASEHKLIIRGSTATNLLLGDESDPISLDFDSFHYDFFSDDIVKHSRMLADILYAEDPSYLGHYTCVSTKIPNKLMVITVDGRSLFEFSSIPTRRDLLVSQIIIPSIRPAQFAKNVEGIPIPLYCAGPDIQLISIYQQLCSPVDASSWHILISKEVNLRRFFMNEFKSKLNIIRGQTGGSEPRIRSTSPIKFRQLLRNGFAVHPGRVLIGPIAILLYTTKKITGYERLQVITEMNLENEAIEIAAIAKTLGVNIQWKIDDPKLVTDERLRRLTVFQVLDNKKENIIDVYNTASYDLIPYITLDTTYRYNVAKFKDIPSKIKIGTPFVLMRFRLSDIWTIQLILSMGVLLPKYAEEFILLALNDYVIISDYYDNLVNLSSDPSIAIRIFPLTSYIGQYESFSVASRRLLRTRKGPKFHLSYYPATAYNISR